MSGRSWRVSPWDADPLSWFTTPNLPLAAAGLALLHGLVVLGPVGQAGSRPLVQVGAVALSVLAVVWVHLVTRPRRGPFTMWRALMGVALSSLAVVISALGYSGESFLIELWWAPLSASLVLFAMVPYASAARLTTVGGLLVVVTTVATLTFVVPNDPTWPPFSDVAIALFPTIIGVTGAVVMIRSITLGLARWSERPLDVRGVDARVDTLAAAAVDEATRIRIAPATAFIASILDGGEVSAGDADRASAIAQRLRRELTGEIDRTWIERVARGRAVTVVDPERLAERLDLAQRTVLRALLDTLLGHTDSPIGSARVELRHTGNGAIAVALRIVSTLPEGRRETFLAPYYVSLQSSVDNLQWRTGPVTAVEFEVSGAARERPAVLRIPVPGTPGGPTPR